MVACVGVEGWKSRSLARLACRLGLAGAVAWSLLSSVPSAAEPVVTAADTALILAGLPPARGSALEPLTRSQAFQQHAREFDQSWTRLEAGQLARIREWSAKEIAPTAAPLFYFFSGPDYLYAGSFFPAATTYVLAGLEPVGPIPRVSETSLRALPQLRGSLNTVMSYSFFKTAEMRVRFEAGTFTGTLPILYIFLARAGATIEATTLVSLDEAGREVAADALSARASVNGAKIVFTSGDGIRRTLYYFQTDISDRGPSVAPFLDFCRSLGQGDGFIKSASYLMHGGNFAKAREFLLTNTRTLLQDDSGIPVRHFSEPDWKLAARGRYVGPINLFGQFYQPQLASLHRLQRPEQLPFGVGYRWRPNESSLLLATRRGARAEHAFKN